MKIEVYVDWENREIYTKKETDTAIKTKAADYLCDDGFVTDFLCDDNDLTYADLWFMSEERKEFLKKKLEERAMDEAADDFYRECDEYELEI